MAAGYGVGASLVSAGLDQKRQATDVLGRAADMESRRNAQNTALAGQEKAGKQQLGGTLGALAGAEYGSALGPWGALIGGALGAVAGGWM
jgi:hypothetical protein